jgi:hypothetical protein
MAKTRFGKTRRGNGFGRRNAVANPAARGHDGEKAQDITARRPGARMRSLSTVLFLVLAPLGCGRVEFDDDERPKLEKAYFEKAAMDFHLRRAQSPPTGKDVLSEEAYLVTP